MPKSADLNPLTSADPDGAASIPGAVELAAGAGGVGTAGAAGAADTAGAGWAAKPAPVPRAALKAIAKLITAHHCGWRTAQVTSSLTKQPLRAATSFKLPP
jgi:hypothetical protein